MEVKGVKDDSLIDNLQLCVKVFSTKSILSLTPFKTFNSQKLSECET